MLSIIIPTLNEEKIIEKMLTSLKELTDFPYEIIVSDGNSTDRTVEIARNHAHKVVVHDGKTRQTIGEGRNAGAEVALGEYLVFLDSDVFIPNSNAHFARAISHFEKNKNLLALTVLLKTLPEHETMGDYISWKIVNSAHRLLNNIFHIGTSSGEFQMFRKEAFQSIEGYSKTLCFGEDAEIFYRLSKIGRTWLDPKLHVFHTSRRAHNMGWLSLWSVWTVNVISNWIRKKPVSKEWKVSR